MNLRTLLAIAACFGIESKSRLDEPDRTDSRRMPKIRRELASGVASRSGNYRGQSPEAAMAAIDAAQAKRARRIDRNKRLAGEVV